MAWSSSATARQIQADVERSGDEPFMLARMVPKAAVLVSASRYVAGRVAESSLGSTVHILDDGFQHFDLMRDVDLLVAPETLDDARTLPTGRFREPLDAASAADALLIDRAEALCHHIAAQDPRVAQRLQPGRSPCRRAPQCGHRVRVQPTPHRARCRQTGVRICRHCEAGALLQRSGKVGVAPHRPAIVPRSSSLFARETSKRWRGRPGHLVPRSC